MSHSAPNTVFTEADEPAFREEVRKFVASHLDPGTRHKVENGLYLEKND